MKEVPTRAAVWKLNKYYITDTNWFELINVIQIYVTHVQ